MDTPKRLPNKEWLKRRREGYRLRCVHCEKMQWERKSSRPRSKKLKQDGSTVYLKVHEDRPWDGQYYCKSCETHSDGVRDMKTGEYICKEDDYISQDIDEYNSFMQKAPRFQRVNK